MKIEKIIANVKVSLEGPNISDVLGKQKIEVSNMLEKSRPLRGRTYPLTTDGRILARKPHVIDGLPTLEAYVRSDDTSTIRYFLGIEEVHAHIKDSENDIKWPAGTVLKFDFSKTGKFVY